MSRGIARTERPSWVTQSGDGIAVRGGYGPDFAEFIIGPAEGRTRWLNPGATIARQLLIKGAMILSNSSIDIDPECRSPLM